VWVSGCEGVGGRQ